MSWPRRETKYPMEVECFLPCVHDPGLLLVDGQLHGSNDLPGCFPSLSVRSRAENLSGSFHSAHPLPILLFSPPRILPPIPRKAVLPSPLVAGANHRAKGGRAMRPGTMLRHFLLIAATTAGGTLLAPRLPAEGEALPAAPAAGPTAEAVEFFEARVRPVLVENCLECHGQKS